MFQFEYEQHNATSADLHATDGLANSIHAPKLEGAPHKFADIVTMYTNAKAHPVSEIFTSLQTKSTTERLPI